MDIKMNKDTAELLSIISGIVEEEPELLNARENEIYLRLSETGFEDAALALAERKFSLIGLFCAEAFEKKGGFTLFYVFKQAGRAPALVLVREAEKEKKVPSVAGTFPSASWFEREIRDGFGLDFAGALDTRRLFLHECYPEDFHPLLKTFKNGPIRPSEFPRKEYRFRQVKGEGVYQIPVGPVHAGIIEPGHFRFSVIGEPIFSLEIRLFYKHRGIEKLAEGKSPSECVALAEAVSGDESMANATGFCMAVEQVCGIKVPERAERLRAIMLELERVYSLLGDLAGMAVDVGFSLVASPFLILREEAFRQNEKLTGSRFLRGITIPGGLKKDIPDSLLNDLPAFLEKFSRAFETAFERAMSSSSLIDRFATTGVIKKELVSPLNLTGPLARASGCPADTRLDRPYGAYKDFAPELSVRKIGDVFSRFEVKANEVRASADLILRLAEKLPQGPIFAESTGYAGYAGHNLREANCPGATGYSLALVEAPRGQNLHWVYMKNGLVDRYKVRTASFCNWQVIEHAVLGNIVPDFPLINKSLNLSYAGTDL
ncbi:NADH-quinone oxidoreductase subunit C [Methanosarcina sp. 1.H.A.2.2]|uniref:hydrogenase large subunit n=1 Tax=Methanosarcina sp. 1.H.A.2.2 TaxID=1483601 RepID=UPI00062126B4|nr:NADH-quinone oxidoreductase subunit C [Methanosarcina sp. 1.H.A.2.2]KKH50703.1 hydrogenase [Methanosarcina sp. 1.H.A.2.2]